MPGTVSASEGPMTALVSSTHDVRGTGLGSADHRWELRLDEFEDGHRERTFECVECGAVRVE